MPCFSNPCFSGNFQLRGTDRRQKTRRFPPFAPVSASRAVFRICGALVVSDFVDIFLCVVTDLHSVVTLYEIKTVTASLFCGVLKISSIFLLFRICSTVHSITTSLPIVFSAHSLNVSNYSVSESSSERINFSLLSSRYFPIWNSQGILNTTQLLSSQFSDSS